MIASVEPYIFHITPAASESGTGVEQPSRAVIANNNSTEMTNRSSAAIDDIYKPIAMVGKYLGIVQLPDLYETGGSESKKFVLNKILPIINLIFQLFAAFNMIHLLIACRLSGAAKGVNNFALIAVNFVAIAFAPLISIIYLAKSSRLLTKFIRATDSVAILLQPRKRHLINFATTGLLVAILALVAKSCCWMYRLHVSATESHIDLKSWFTSNFYGLALICFIFGMFLMSVTECLAHFVYIMLQHVIKTAFDELINGVKDGGRHPGSAAMAVKYYRELYQRLGQLSELLNELSSPILFLTYIFDNLAAITIISLVINGVITKTSSWETQVTLLVMFAVHTSFIIMYSIFAKATTSSAADVLPALFSTTDFELTETNAEVELFALRAQCKKLTFTASGFFQINMGILSTIVGAIASYVIIMIQFSS